MKINQLILGIGYWSYKYRTHGIGFEKKNRNTGAGIINNIYNNDNYLVIVDIA